MANCMVSSDHPAFAVHKHACNSTYGPHYRDAHGQVDPRNVLVLGRAKNSIPHDVEEILREKLRANPGQSKQQNKVTVSGNALDDPEGFGAVYLIAAPDGPRAAFLKADNAHKAVRNLAKWCIEPKNKNKGPDAYKQPLSTTISNAATAIDVIHECLGAGWSAPTLGMFFRGANRILTDNKKLLSTLLTQTEEFGEDTLMATTYDGWADGTEVPTRQVEPRGGSHAVPATHERGRGAVCRHEARARHCDGDVGVDQAPARRRDRRLRLEEASDALISPQSLCVVIDFALCCEGFRITIKQRTTQQRHRERFQLHPRSTAAESCGRCCCALSHGSGGGIVN